MTRSAWRSFVATVWLELVLASRSRRLYALAGFALIPAGLALIVRLDAHLGGPPKDVVEFLLRLDMLFLQLVVPLTALMLGAATIQDEIENRSWHHRLLTPLPPWGILLAKYLAALSIVVVLGLAGVTVFTVAATVGAPLGVAGVMGVTSRFALGVLAASACYTAAFTLIGAMFSRPLIVGVIYGLISEVLLQRLPVEVVARTFTVVYHVRALVNPSDLDPAHEATAELLAAGYSALWSPWASAASLVAFAVVVTSAACVYVHHREIVGRPLR